MAYGPPHPPDSSVSEWLRQLKKGGGQFAAMLNASDRESGDGFRHTIAEICQQRRLGPKQPAA